MTLLQRFSLISFAAMGLFGFAFGSVVTTSMENYMLSKAIEDSTDIVHQNVKKHFKPDDLSGPKTGENYARFAEEIDHLSLGPDTKRIKIWNREKSLVWATEEELVGRANATYAPPDQALRGEVVSRFEVQEETASDSMSRFLEIYVPIRLRDQGEILGVFEVYMDLTPLQGAISKHKRIIWIWTLTGYCLLYGVLFGIVWRASRRIERQNREIARSEHRYRSLVESGPDSIISIDRNGKIILFNKASERIFGYSAEEILGRPVTLLIPERYQENHDRKMHQAFVSGEITGNAWPQEYEALHKVGTRFPIDISRSVSGKGEDVSITAIVRDISRRKIMQEQLVEAEKHASVAIIAGSIGHELNNVVGGLSIYAEMLQDSPDDLELASKCAEIFYSQTDRLKAHAKNLLSLSQPTKPVMREINLNEFLDNVTEMLVVSGVLKMFTIHKKYEDNLPRIAGDEMLLEQVVRNLEINAAHAMENHGVLSITTRSSEDRSYVEFMISDTGHGISEEKRHQIFLPFVTTKEKGKGTGLGLFIVKQIVEQHNGQMELHSEVGKGTTITIGLQASTGRSGS